MHGSGMHGLMARALDRLRDYSIGGAMGPALAALRESPEDRRCLQDVEDCHWSLVQGLSQVLQIQQGLVIRRGDPLLLAGSKTAKLTEQLDGLSRHGSGYLSREYAWAAMDLDRCLQNFGQLLRGG